MKKILLTAIAALTLSITVPADQPDDIRDRIAELEAQKESIEAEIEELKKLLPEEDSWLTYEDDLISFQYPQEPYAIERDGRSSGTMVNYYFYDTSTKRRRTVLYISFTRNPDHEPFEYTDRYEPVEDSLLYKDMKSEDEVYIYGNTINDITYEIGFYPTEDNRDEFFDVFDSIVVSDQADTKIMKACGDDIIINTTANNTDE